MGDHKVLTFNWRDSNIDIKVEIDKCTLLDLIVEYEDEAERRGIHLDFGYPTFAYAWNMRHKWLENDAHLMQMFERFKDSTEIMIWVRTKMQPTPLYKLVMNLRRQNEHKKTVEVDGNAENEDENDTEDEFDVSLNDLEDTSVKPSTSNPKQKPKTKAKPKPIAKPKTKAKPKPKPKPKTKTTITPNILPSPPISPNTAFKNLKIRRSPRFSPLPNTNNDTVSANASANASVNAFDQSAMTQTQSNFVESCNSTLGVDRCRPVLTLLEGIRRVCMVRMATRQQAASTWHDDDLCPKIVKILKVISKETISCKAYMSKPGEYEIHEGTSQFPLSLNSKICSCGAWQLSGIPCRHAIRAMLHAKIDPHKVVSTWYSVKTYKQAYSFGINPIPDKDQWPSFEDIPTIKPPTLKRGVGRPCRNRKREEGEDQKGKRAKTVKCTKCDCYGHNSRTCRGGLTAKKKKEAQEKGEPVVIRNPRVRDQSNAAKAAAKAAKEASKSSQATEINISQPASSNI
ncbi:uncharacterized protein LOC135147691 isoform X2 [Daucus carota subsp. sativus]